MVLICGIPTEPPLQLIINQLAKMGIPTAVFNQRHFPEINMKWALRKGLISGELQLDDTCYVLENFQGVYTRLTDENTLPELKQQDQRPAVKQHCHRLHATLMTWMELCPARVVNRTRSMLSNGSKPYQLQLIRHTGFDIPDTLITNDPRSVLDFKKKHGRIIYKSISGIRSIVKEFGREDEKKLSLIRWCPVQFQEWIDGYDVRVHVIGKKVIATKIVSGATDYRYAGRENKQAHLEPFHLSDPVRKRCISLGHSLGLAFSGIDLRFASDGRIVCFEVNPSPGYSYYEEQTGQPIAKTVAEFLAFGN